MLRTFAAGRLGQDAKHTTTQGGTDICRFSVATDVGYGENKQTIWLDVSKFGKGAEGLARILRKGSRLSVFLYSEIGGCLLRCEPDVCEIEDGVASCLPPPSGFRKSNAAWTSSGT